MSNQNPASSPSTLVANMPTSNVEPIVDTLNWVLTASVAVVLVLRVHSKDRRRTPLWWDDYIMWTSWFLLLALTLICAFAARLDSMRQMQMDEPVARRDIIIIDNDNSLTEGGFPNLADAVAATVALATTALSQTGLAATLVKAVGFSRKGSSSSSFIGIPTWPRTVAWATIAVVNTAAAATGLFLWLQCTPVQKTFQNVDFGFCWPGRVMIVAQIVNAAVSGTADVALSFTAVYVVYTKTSKQGYQIGAWFCAKLGISAGIVSFAKAALISTVASGDLSDNNMLKIMIWTVVEPASIIIAGSLPELRNLVWKQAPPAGLHAQELHHINHDYKWERVVLGDDFDYVLQQYMEAGKKSFEHAEQQAATRRASIQSSSSSMAGEATWWV